MIKTPLRSWVRLCNTSLCSSMWAQTILINNTQKTKDKADSKCHFRTVWPGIHVLISQPDSYIVCVKLCTMKYVGLETLIWVSLSFPLGELWRSSLRNGETQLALPANTNKYLMWINFTDASSTHAGQPCKTGRATSGKRLFQRNSNARNKFGGSASLR